VSLQGAAFDDVNMAEVTIHNANLHNMRIDGAYIVGLTIHGVRVDDLIEAELNRRDPERSRLQIQDCSNPDEVRAVMAHLDELRAAFRAMLRATPPSRLNCSPGPDRWTALEHVRHLASTEDLYLNRWILQNDKPPLRLGKLPPFMHGRPEYAVMESEPTEDLETVLAAWDKVHEGTQALVKSITSEVLRRDTSAVDSGQGTVGGNLRVLAAHDLEHIRMAETALCDSASLEL